MMIFLFILFYFYIYIILKKYIITINISIINNQIIKLLSKRFMFEFFFKKAGKIKINTPNKSINAKI